VRFPRWRRSQVTRLRSAEQDVGSQWMRAYQGGYPAATPGTEVRQQIARAEAVWDRARASSSPLERAAAAMPVGRARDAGTVYARAYAQKARRRSR
jgi:hypothetical protein